MQAKGRRTTRIVIIVLAVLLAFSLCALAGTILYSRFHGGAAVTATAPDNLITPDSVSASASSGMAEAVLTEAVSSGENQSVDRTVDDPSDRSATTICLYSKQPEENVTFNLKNMLPGDEVVQYYRVQVSHHDRVTVHYQATVRAGYEKLAEVLQIRIKLLSTGETLYDGALQGMGDSLTYELTSTEQTVDTLSYEITVSLGTEVGNAYQNRELIADFNWWVTQAENLSPAPKTGDSFQLFLWFVIALASSALCTTLLVTRRSREEEKHA